MEGILEKGEIACVAHQNISMTNEKKQETAYTLWKNVTSQNDHGKKW